MPDYFEALEVVQRMRDQIHWAVVKTNTDWSLTPHNVMAKELWLEIGGLLGWDAPSGEKKPHIPFRVRTPNEQKMFECLCEMAESVGIRSLEINQEDVIARLKTEAGAIKDAYERGKKEMQDFYAPKVDIFIKSGDDLLEKYIKSEADNKAINAQLDECRQQLAFAKAQAMRDVGMQLDLMAAEMRRKARQEMPVDVPNS